MRMARIPHLALSALLAAASAASSAAEADDPTVSENEMTLRLVSRAAATPGLALSALVVGADGDGVAIAGPAPGRVLRRGAVFEGSADGIGFSASVRSVSERGVELAPDATGPSVSVKGGFKPLDPPADPPPEFLRYVEFTEVPLQTAARLLSDQSGANISVSAAAGGRPVSVFLRNVPAMSAVEEICRTAGLWFRREKNGGVVRIMTMDEYSENLNTFREEATETFTLLYPNVVEAASVIYGLYPDRTFLSLGEEEFDEDDEYDLSRRFRRFRVLEDNGGSQFLDIDPPQTSSAGTRSGSGVFSYSRGSMTSRMTQWDQLRERARRAGRYAGVSTVPLDDASLMERAYASGDTNLLEKVKGHVSAAGAANIFVTISRRNNMLIVRTGDLRAMDEIRSMVKRLDVPTPMVLLELKILEVAIDDDYEATFSYAFNRSSHTLGNSGSAAGSLAQTAMDSFNPSMAFTVLNKNLEAKIALSQKDGKVRTLATPTLLVANNEVSRIFSGKEYPLVSGWRQGDTVVSDSGIVQGAMTVEIEKKDVGTMLLVTPSINADKTVTLRLLQENSEVSPEKVDIPVDGGSGESKSIEYVESRQIAGTFVAKDGMTVMAGGLVKETESETYWRTPVLGSMPLLGWLFRGTEKIKERTELIVLIRPHVVSTPVEGGKISKELMEALSAHPAADGSDSMGVHKTDRRRTLGDDVRAVVE